MATRPYNPAPLNKALESLERAIAQPKNEFNRDSVIQRFEFTLELAWKGMKIRLESAGVVLSEPTPKGVIREAAKAGKVSDPTLWLEFVDQRNQTSHTYNEAIAEAVYQAALKLPAEVRKILAWLSSG